MKISSSIQALFGGLLMKFNILSLWRCYLLSGTICLGDGLAYIIILLTALLTFVSRLLRSWFHLLCYAVAFSIPPWRFSIEFTLRYCLFFPYVFFLQYVLLIRSLSIIFVTNYMVLTDNVHWPHLTLSDTLVFHIGLRTVI